MVLANRDHFTPNLVGMVLLENAPNEECIVVDRTKVATRRVDFLTICVLLSIKKLNFVEQLLSFSLYVERSVEKIVLVTRFPFLTGGFFHERF